MASEQNAKAAYLILDGYGMPDGPIRVMDRIEAELNARDAAHAAALAEKDAEIVRLRAKLARVLDWLRYAANSPGGIAAEIKSTLDAEGA